jgi:hypothetical protein
MKHLVISLALALLALPAFSQLAPLPEQYGAFGVSLNPGAAPPVQGDVEWGKLVGGNTYAGMAAGVIPSTQGTLSLTTAQATIRQVAWRNNRLALVIDGKFGIANEGSGATGGAITGAGGVVFGIHRFSFGKLSAYVGAKAVKTSLQEKSFGPSVGLVFTPR